MSRRPAIFKQADLAKVLRAARAAGVTLSRIEIEPATGKITMTTNTAGGGEQVGELDKWMANHARESERR